MTIMKMFHNDENVVVSFDTDSDLVAIGFIIFIWHILVMIMSM
jgi:hypothetical protein